jgi:hypothetical protein
VASTNGLCKAKYPERDFPDSVRQKKGTAGRTLFSYITVFINGKYTLGLIFKKGKSAILQP